MSGIVKSAQSVTAMFTTSLASTGAASNADSLPTGTLYVNGTADAATVTVTNVTTGRYKAAVTLPTLAAGDVVDLHIAATVSTVAGGGIVWSAIADTKRLSDTLSSDVVSISGDSAAADNLEAAADGTGYNLGGGSVVAASVTGAVGSVTGAVGSVTGNVGGNVVGSVASVTGAVGSVAAGGITASSIAADAIGASELAADAVAEIQSGLALASDLATLATYVDTEVAAIKAKTDNLPTDPADQSLVEAAIAAGDDATLAAIAARPSVADFWSGITATAARFIADHTLRRSWASAAVSANGDTLSFRSLLGAVAKLVNRVGIGGATLTVYQDDDTTALGEQTLTSDAAAEPITGANTV